MILVHVSYVPLFSGKTTTVEVLMAPNSSLYGTLMQARSQDLEFKLANCDVYVGRRLIERTRYTSTHLDSTCVVVIKAHTGDIVQI